MSTKFTSFITAAAYAALNISDKEVYLDTFGKEFAAEEAQTPKSTKTSVFADEEPASSDEESDSDETSDSDEESDNTPATTVNTVGQDFLATQGKYSVEGDRVYMNTYITIGNTKFKGPRVELTSKNMCLSSWDKDEKTFTKEESDVVNLIKLIRLHGADKVNELSTVDVSFAKEGDKNASGFADPIAVLMAEAEAEKAKAKAEAEAK